MTILTEKFDAYGEVLPGEARDHREAAGTASSGVLSRIGQYAFWLLVVVIVAARIISYQAAPAVEVGGEGPVKQAVTR